MRSTPAVALATLLILSGFALAGCSQWFENPAKPANDAIAVANAHLKRAGASESEVTTAAATLEGVAYTRKGARAALKTVEAIDTALATQKAELLAGKAAMDGIAKLDVETELKQYAKLEAAAIDTRVTMVDTESRLYEALAKLYTTIGKRGVKTNAQELTAAIGQIRREIASLTDQVTVQTKAAADYFAKNRLGS